MGGLMSGLLDRGGALQLPFSDDAAMEILSIMQARQEEREAMNAFAMRLSVRSRLMLTTTLGHSLS